MRKKVIEDIMSEIRSKDKKNDKWEVFHKNLEYYENIYEANKKKGIKPAGELLVEYCLAYASEFDYMHGYAYSYAAATLIEEGDEDRAFDVLKKLGEDREYTEKQRLFMDRMLAKKRR